MRRLNVTAPRKVRQSELQGLSSQSWLSPVHPEEYGDDDDDDEEDRLRHVKVRRPASHFAYM
jgi:hypothetical protein